MGATDAAGSDRGGGPSVRMARLRQPRDLLRGRRAQHVDELAQLRVRGVRPGRHDHGRQAPRSALGAGACRCGCSGMHGWAIVAPQVLEGMACVLVLYRVVRRLSGAVAGILAAGVLVLSPATVALNRGNISDTLMVLLLLLAADATVSAIISGRMRSLILAGVLVGLAFQAKMIEAWLVLPALALAYLVGTRGGLGRRVARLGAAGVVVAAVSVSWMLLVTVWPASHRPYVDGSRTNSIFGQVFVYNGFGRLDQASPNQLLTKSIGLALGSAPASWHRLLSGANGRDTAWLIPAALIALAACALVSQRRDDLLLRAGTVLWGTWLVVLVVVFSISTTVNPYYTAALSPAIAALLGMGVALAWQYRARHSVRRLVGATVAVTCGYAVCAASGARGGSPQRPADRCRGAWSRGDPGAADPGEGVDARGGDRTGRGRPGRGAHGRIDIGRGEAVRTVRHAVRERGRL